MTGDLQEKITHLPMLLKESIEPMYDYLIQFSAFKSLDGAVRGIYEWVSDHFFSQLEKQTYA